MTERPTGRRNKETYDCLGGRVYKARKKDICLRWKAQRHMAMNNLNM
jgi:hypothetical protein